MKKFFAGILGVFSCLALASCGDNKENQAVLSLIMPDINNNSCIEIYNYSDTSMNLNDYKIGIYGKTTSKEPTRYVDLSGTLEAKKVYAVANTNASDEVKMLCDATSDNLVIGGLEAVGLFHKNELVDVVGNIGFRNQLGGMTVVRKTWDIEAVTKYDSYKYLFYGESDTSCLGSFYNTVTEEELMAGPKFLESYLDIDFFNPSTPKLGTGGATEVRLQSNIDGDTSKFYFTINIEDYVDADQISYNSNGKYTKVRYCSVDTAETMSNMIQEWGWPAKLNTAKLQNEADKIYVRNNDGESLIDMGYGRMMGYVFVVKDGDSTLVNFDIIIKGYSEANFTMNKKMSYKGLPYYGYFTNAMEYAKRNNLGRYGEKDPYWDYVNNKSIYA